MTLIVKGWSEHYETAASRKLENPRWVAVPNRHDGTGFMELMDHPNGMAHFGAWVLILQVASRMPERGVLRTDRGRDLAAHSLARLTSGDCDIFQEAITRLLDIGWLEENDAMPVESQPNGGISQSSGGISQPNGGTSRSSANQSVLHNRTGQNRTEQGTGVAAGSARTREADPKPTETAAATAAEGKAFIRVQPYRKEEVVRALTRGDLMGLIGAMGGNKDRDREGEWFRECSDLPFIAIAAIFDWSTQEKNPIREPSGFRKARAAWMEKPKEWRSTWGNNLAAELGLPPPLKRPATPPTQPNTESA